MTDPDTAPSRAPRWYTGVPRSAWLVFAVCWLGGLFDGLDTLLFTLALKPAVSELAGTSDPAVISSVGSRIQAAFLVGWMAGGVAFGWIADRYGRLRAMVGSILLYSVTTGACGLARTPAELGLARALTGLGVGGEIVVIVAMVAETWPERSRVQALGLLSSAVQTGYLASAFVFRFVAPYGWRWVFAAGAVPALLVFAVRLTLRESPRWLAARGRAPAPSPAELFEPALRRRTLAAAVLCTAALVGFWACNTWVPTWIQDLVAGPAIEEKSRATIAFSSAAVAATLLGGTVADRLGRRLSLALGFTASTVTIAALFLAVSGAGLALYALYAAVGFASGTVIAVLYVYLPELFPTRLRGTGKGLVFNVGRLATAAGVLASGWLISVLSGSYAAAGAVMSLVWLVGLPALAFAPETRGAPLPD